MFKSTARIGLFRYQSYGRFRANSTVSSICQDLKPTQKDRRSITQLERAAEERCVGCSVLGVLLKPYWANYNMVGGGWRFGQSENTLSIDLVYPGASYGKVLQYTDPDRVVTSFEIWTLTRTFMDAFGSPTSTYVS